MQRAEDVTFGGADFDRAAHIRPETAQVSDLLSQSGDCVLPVWQGKILVRDQGDAALVFVPSDDPILTHASETPIFLGLTPDGPVFSADVSAWQPAADVERPDQAVFFDPSVQALPNSGGAFTELRAVMAALSPLEAEIAATARSLLSWHKSHQYCSACGQKSAFSQAGWQRDCPDCNTRHFPRTDPVVIMLVTRGNSVLVGRSPGWPEGMFSLLAGFVEPGETIEAAVRREVFEECGIRTGAVTYLASQPWPYPSSLMIGCAALALDDKITIDPIEIEEAKWLSREDMLDVFSGQSTQMLPPRNGAIAQFILKNWLADCLD